MLPTSGRLGAIGALHRNLSQIDNTHSNMSSSLKPMDRTVPRVGQLEKEIKALKAENEDLKAHLEESRSALKRLTSEQGHEKFDERRINLLKLHIIQLERQVLLMSEALASRSATLMEVENALTWLSDKFRYFIGLEIKGSEVPVPRSDLINMVSTSESARIKLFKNVENSSKENLSRPYMFLNDFLRPGTEKKYTILDTCLCCTEYLNLKHVAQLESKLSLLFKELIKVSEILSSRMVTSQEGASRHVTSAVWEREQKLVRLSAAMARDCAGDLLSLSLLFPAAPWPALSKPAVKDVTYESLLPFLPPLPRSKAAEVERCVTAALSACNHHCHMLNQEVGALRDEVRFHQAVYDIQLKYIQEAFNALREGYTNFEKSIKELIVQPMKKMIEHYKSLRKFQGEEDLRNFLEYFKENEEQLALIIQQLEVTETASESGRNSLSQFGKEFMSCLNDLVVSRQTERDQAASQKKELQTAQQCLEERLQLTRDLESPGDGDQSNMAVNSMVQNQAAAKTPTFTPPHSGEMQRQREPGLESGHKFKHKHLLVKSKMPPFKISDNAETCTEMSYGSLSQQGSGTMPEDFVSEHCAMVFPDIQKTTAHVKSSPATAPQSNISKSLQGKPPSYRKTKDVPDFSKAQKKSEVYQPKLYVANRTLQLRRSESLTRLSEPSPEGILKNTSSSHVNTQGDGEES